MQDEDRVALLGLGLNTGWTYCGAKNIVSQLNSVRAVPVIPACAASQPDADALPPLVLTRWTDVTRPSVPSPLRFTTDTSNQGMDSESDEGTLGAAVPVMRLPSLASQDGPAKCLPKGLPLSSVSWASGAFRTQVYCAPSTSQMYIWSPLPCTRKQRVFTGGRLKFPRHLLRVCGERDEKAGGE